MSTRTNVEAAEKPASEINQLGLWDSLPECGDCGDLFYPESSPDFDRCWMCADRHAEESGW